MVPQGDDGLSKEAADPKEPRYRLPHDRLVPAIRSRTEADLSEAERARMRLDLGFRAWINNQRSNKFLLDGQDLTLALRHRAWLFFRQPAPEKQAYLAKSRWRRWRRRCLTTSLILTFLLAMFAGGRYAHAILWEIAKASLVHRGFAVEPIGDYASVRPKKDGSDPIPTDVDSLFWRSAEYR